MHIELLKYCVELVLVNVHRSLWQDVFASSIKLLIGHSLTVPVVVCQNDILHTDGVFGIFVFFKDRQPCKPRVLLFSVGLIVMPPCKRYKTQDARCKMQDARCKMPLPICESVLDTCSLKASL